MTTSLAAGEAPVSWNADDPGLEWGPCPDWLPEGCMASYLNGAPGESNSDLLFRIPANSTLANHWHTSAERMILVAGEFHVFYQGHDPVVMTPGTYAYGPAKLEHSAECRDAGDCLLFVAAVEPFDAHPVEAD